MGSENPDDHQRVAGTYNLEEQKKRKRAESYEKSVTKPSLDDVRKFRKRFLELGESSGHARDAVGKQTHLVDSLWELIKTVLPFLFILLFFCHKTSAQLNIKRSYK